MEAERRCSGCQKSLPAGSTVAICPECLIQAGFSTDGEQESAGPDRAFTVPPASEVSRWLPQFQRVELVGRGGMGAVYKARQPTLERWVAIKILPPTTANDPGFAERFQREARALARLSHPNIVAVYDFGRAGELPYLLMEYIEGANLRELEQSGRLTPAQALQIIPQICDALEFAHGEGIVHRDIKPENILLDRKNRVKITDFGIAKILGATPEKLGLTGARDVVGTPHYMAPEQVERPLAVDHRADLYSLGVVFYELLTGELPMGRFALPSAKAPVDTRLDKVVLRALEKEPARRYQHASQLKLDVQNIAASPSSHRHGTQPAQSKNRFWLYALVTTGVVLFLGVALFAGGWLRGFLGSGGSGTAKPSALTDTNKAQARFGVPASSLSGATSNNTTLRTPRRPVEPRELTSAERREALLDLKSPNWGPRQGAAARLALAKPAEPRGEIVRALIEALQDSQWSVRQNAARALGSWGAGDAVTPLIKLLADKEFSVRWTALEALGKLKDPQGTAALAAHLAVNPDLQPAAQALQAVGTPAETAVAAVLKSPDPEVRRQGCRILQAIATTNSVPALESALADNDPFVPMLAREALRRIETPQPTGTLSNTNTSKP